MAVVQGKNKATSKAKKVSASKKGSSKPAAPKKKTLLKTTSKKVVAPKKALTAKKTTAVKKKTAAVKTPPKKTSKTTVPKKQLKKSQSLKTVLSSVKKQSVVKKSSKTTIKAPKKKTVVTQKTTVKAKKSMNSRAMPAKKAKKVLKTASAKKTSKNLKKTPITSVKISVKKQPNKKSSVSTVVAKRKINTASASKQKTPAVQKNLSKSTAKKLPIHKTSKLSVKSIVQRKVEKKAAETKVSAVKKNKTPMMPSEKSVKRINKFSEKKPAVSFVSMKQTATLKSKGSSKTAKVLSWKTGNTVSTSSPSITNFSKKMDNTKMNEKLPPILLGEETIPAYVLQGNELYMSEAQRAHFSHILTIMKNQLMEDVDKTVTNMRDDDKNLADFVDKAAKEEEMNLMLRTRNREGKLLKKIENALDRLKSDDFGYCESCGIEIGLRRLEARPTATLCIDCKTLAEIREKQGAS